MNLLFIAIFGYYFTTIFAKTPDSSVPVCHNVLNWTEINGNYYKHKSYIRRARFGVINIKPDENVETIYLQIKLKQPIKEVFGNYLGEVTTEDNRIFDIVISNYNKHTRQYIFKKNVVTPFNFYIRFGFGDKPQIIEILLNGVNLCHSSSKSVESAIDDKTKNWHIPPSANSKPITITARASNEACGMSSINTLDNLMSRTPAQKGEFPWHVSIYKTKDTIWSTYGCGGTLVSKLFVVTVAHCVTELDTEKPIRSDTIQVHLGKHERRDWSSNSLQTRSVVKIIIHPDYNSTTFYNNTALLKLKTSASINDYVRPVCLWNHRTHIDLDRKTGLIPGWGGIEADNNSNVLHKVALTVLTYDQCYFKNKDYVWAFSKLYYTFCVGYENSTKEADVCRGDGGSGMVLPVDDASEQWQLVGMVSVIIKPDKRCGSGIPIFINMLNATQWIQDTMRGNS